MLENRDVVGQDMTAQLANIVGKNERNGSKSKVNVDTEVDEQFTPMEVFVLKFLSQPWMVSPSAHVPRLRFLFNTDLLA